MITPTPPTNLFFNNGEDSHVYSLKKGEDTNTKEFTVHIKPKRDDPAET